MKFLYLASLYVSCILLTSCTEVTVIPWIHTKKVPIYRNKDNEIMEKVVIDTSNPMEENEVDLDTLEELLEKFKAYNEALKLRKSKN